MLEIFHQAKDKLSSCKLFCKYLFALIRLRNKKIEVQILSNIETLNYIKNKQCSVIRFGDGEFMLMNGKSFPFQRFDKKLALELNDCLNEQSNNILICLPEPIYSCNKLVKKSKWYWTTVLYKNYAVFEKYIPRHRTFGNAFISRPYMVYKNKDEAVDCFNLLKQLWCERNVIIVEGEYSRTGVGNDLFDNVKSLQRIITTSANAFDFYGDIFDSVINLSKNFDKLIVLIALGPTAKPLVRDLAKMNIWAIDIGHIDSEYEWFKVKATEKIKLEGKHTADLIDDTIDLCLSEEYNRTVKLRIGL